jgi:D-3-phosphoglycerate dehydrogenase
MATPFRLLITDRFDAEAHALLKGDPRFHVSVSQDAKPTANELELQDGLIIRSRTRIDEDLLSKAPNLKVVVSATSGFDHFDFSATLRRTGLAVMHTPNANAASACELTLALMLACSRKLIDAHRAVKAGNWNREALVGRELHGQTIGIIGLGRIGSRVARIAHAFGMKVVAFDPYVEEEAFARTSAERISFEELLKVADVVTFHVPKTDETHHMLSSQDLENMNRTAILVNVSRGSVIAERDLLHALSEGWIAACGLDVFEREPLPRDSRLTAFPNVVLSPHLGATTHEAFAAASREAAEKLIAFVTSGAVSDLLPPRESWYHESFGVRSAPKSP